MNKNEMLSYTEEKEELNMGFKRNYIQSYLHWQFWIWSSIKMNSCLQEKACSVNFWNSPIHIFYNYMYMSRFTSWPWSYVSWICRFLCNQCLSPLKLWVRIPLRRGVLDTTLCDKLCHLLVTGRWFSPGTPVSFTYKTYCHDITELLLKVALSTMKPNQTIISHLYFTLRVGVCSL